MGTWGVLGNSEPPESLVGAERWPLSIDDGVHSQEDTLSGTPCYPLVGLMDAQKMTAAFDLKKKKSFFFKLLRKKSHCRQSTHVMGLWKALEIG